MRKIALAGLVALALSALAVAATWQTRRDDNASARTLLTSWRSVGGALVGPRLVGASTDIGLTCFRYQVTKRLDRDVLCFAADGPLVELLRETHNRATLVSVATDTDRAPIRLAAAALEHASGVAYQVQRLDSRLAALHKVFGLCSQAVDRTQRLVNGSSAAVGVWFAELDERCGDGAATGRAVAVSTRRLVRLSPLSVRLAALFHAMQASARSYLRAEVTAPASVASELRLRRDARATLAAFARETHVERGRLTGG